MARKITEEFTNTIFETLRENSVKVGEWNDKLMETCEEEKWNEVALQRSRILREVYQNNEEICKQLWESIPADPTDEELDILFGLAYNLHVNGVYVVSVGLRLEQTLLPYFEKRKSYDEIVFLNYAMGYANYLQYDRTVSAVGPTEWLQFYERILSMEDHYCEVVNEVFRGLYFSAYISLIQYSSQYPSLRGRTDEFYLAAHALWEREDVQKLDGKSDYLNAKMKALDDQYIYILSNDPTLITSPEKYCTIAEEILKEVGEITMESDPSGYYRIMRNNVNYLQKQVSLEKSVSDMADYILNTIPPLDFGNSDPETISRLMMNELSVFAYTVSLMKMLSSEHKSLMNDAVNRILHDCVRIPASFDPNNFNLFLYEFYEGVEPYLKSDEEKWKLLMHLILCRQPMTYIHSRMVSEIAVMIGGSIIEHRPELLIGLEGCGDVAEVRKAREKLLNAIHNCGMIHDIGKCRIAIVINTQDRHLTEDEFGILKYHPSLGKNLLAHDKTFAPYTDVILGHHKSYDGKGYPADFDNTTSPIRILIDLVTIADCTDAATDILGRNYNTGKNFRQLLEELIEGAGTKYNPDIVDVIRKDPKLQEKITYLTSDGRSELYRQTCIDITYMHQNASIDF